MALEAFYPTATEHVIAYYSKSLNHAQQKYCTTRRELLAVVATLDHFKGYVWGPRFLIQTDHAALVWLKNLKNIQGMLARWLAKLQQFNFDIVHRPGAQHGNADGLSRCPQYEGGSCATTTNTHQTDPDQPYAYSCEGSSLDSELIPLESGETCVAAIMTAQSENSKLIIAAQNIDSEISIVREWLLTGKFPACIQDFAPASYELKAYWIGRKSLFLDTENILWRNRSATESRAQLVVSMSLRDTIFNDSHHTTYGGHFGMTHTHRKIQLHYFWPGMSDFVRDRITACHKCIARKSPVNRHQPMGHVPVSGRFERVAMDLLDISMFVSCEHDNWDDLLPFMMLAYNTTVHTTTGFTPHRLVFGEECNLPGNLVHRELRPDPPPGDPGTYASWVCQALHEAYDEVRAQGPHTVRKGITTVKR